MNGYSFAKIEALGNDFVWFLCPVTEVPREGVREWIPIVCDRHVGIGADGVIFWGQGETGTTPIWFYNKDGSLAEVCGNGLRAVGIAGRELGLLKPGLVWLRSGRQKFPVDIPESGCESAAGLGPVTREGNREISGKLCSELDSMRLRGGFVRMPNPHVVVFPSGEPSISEMESIAGVLAGLIPGGANVGFAWMKEKETIDLQVMERGVGWTTACGSGAAAAWVIASKKGLVKGPSVVRQRGGELEVWRADDARIWIRGQGSIIFTGSWLRGRSQ